MVLKTEYLVDEKGHKESVVFSIKDYLKLMDYLEVLEDSVDLKKAKDEAKGFKDLEAIVNKLKFRGKLQKN